MPAARIAAAYRAIALRQNAIASNTPIATWRIGAAAQQFLDEAVMFSLIALYFEYRKLQRTPATRATTPRAAIANDVAAHRAMASAA